jgi:hypothetical protein
MIHLEPTRGKVRQTTQMRLSPKAMQLLRQHMELLSLREELLCLRKKVETAELSTERDCKAT